MRLSNKKIAIYIATVLGTTLVVGILLFFSLNRSSWFLLGLLSESAPSSLTIGIKRPTNIFSEKFEHALVPAAIVNNKWHAYVIAQEGGKVSVAGVVNPFHAKEVAENLQRAGKTVKRIGWTIVIAKEGELTQGTWQYLQKGISSLALHVAKYRFPIWPMAIASIQEKQAPYVKSDVVAMLLHDNRGERLIAKEHTRNFGELKSGLENGSEWGSSITPAEAVMVAGLSSLEVLPGAVKDQLSAYIANRFSFTHTRPAFIATITTPERVVLLAEGEDTILGLQGASEANVAELQRLFEAEAAYDYPQRHTFLLPDRTLGYEYIPNIAEVVIEDSAAHSACKALSMHGSKVWICNQANMLFVTTSISLIERGTAFLSEKQERLEITDPTLLTAFSNFAPSFFFTKTEEFSEMRIGK
ncbi:MAG: hypothetical protein WD200_01835 [Candidatus Andersenbacteria bacterium]